jgi:hypothetical protein
MHRSEFTMHAREGLFIIVCPVDFDAYVTRQGLLPQSGLNIQTLALLHSAKFPSEKCFGC